MSAFTFCECPVCEYTIVVPDLPAGSQVACPLCWDDSQHEVGMTARPATDDDRPEGVDFRKLPQTSTFVCRDCGMTSLATCTDEDARNEFRAMFGRAYDPARDGGPICNDCWLKALEKRR